MRASQAASSVSTPTNARNALADLLVPASDDEVDLGAGRGGDHVADPFERHQQVADAFDPHEQNASGLRRPFPPERACHRRDHTERGIGRAHEHALARLVDLQVREHAVPVILPARDPVTIDGSLMCPLEPVVCADW